MRVLIVADWHEPRGGTERYIEMLRGALHALGHESRLLTSGGRALNEVAEQQGFPPDGQAEYQAFAPRSLAGRAFTQLHNPFAAASARAAIDEFAPDAALLFGFLDHLSPGVLAPLTRVPAVAYVSDYKLVCPLSRRLLPDQTICPHRPGLVCWRAGCVGLLHWLRDQPRYAAARHGLRPFRRVLTCSEWMRGVLAEQGVRAESLLIPIADPPAGFARAPSTDPSFLFVGRLSVEKGVEPLLHAFARVRAAIPQVTLRIAGEGEQRARLSQLGRELRLEDAVAFTGWLEPAGLDAELAQAWALVAPSLWAEPMGMVTVEANARGVPVIASAVGGFAETLEPGGGLLVPNGDVAALATAMLEIAGGRSFPDHLVAPEVAARAAARHDLQTHTRQLVALLAAGEAAAT